MPLQDDLTLHATKPATIPESSSVKMNRFTGSDEFSDHAAPSSSSLPEPTIINATQRFRFLSTDKSTAAQEFSLPWHMEGRWFKDIFGRTLMPRGCNVSGITKLPTSPAGDTHTFSTDFFEHRTVSFIGRPFPIEEAPIHFLRLKAWGMTFLRFLIPWEAVEHSGPGIYDDAYLDYVADILTIAERLHFKVFIDPHQDVWSRYSGGSGAPGWTFEVCGLDIRAFRDTGAALVHNTNPLGYPDFIWPSNYGKLASATMFTLFWGGDTFAPHLKMPNGQSAQQYLQDCYCRCYAYIAKRFLKFQCVLGFEAMNEPHQGYIGMKDMTMLRDDELLLYRDTPSPLQSFALGDGICQIVPVYDRSWPYPTKRVARREMNPHGARAWKEGVRCVWRQHGVWDVKYNASTGLPEPYLRQPDYFYQDKRGKPYNFNQDFMAPFFMKYARAIHDVSPSLFVLVEGLPSERPPMLLKGVSLLNDNNNNYGESANASAKNNNTEIHHHHHYHTEYPPRVSEGSPSTDALQSIPIHEKEQHNHWLDERSRDIPLVETSNSETDALLSKHLLAVPSPAVHRLRQGGHAKTLSDSQMTPNTTQLLSAEKKETLSVTSIASHSRSHSDTCAADLRRTLSMTTERACAIPNLVYVPHWYDLKTVFDKYFSERVSFNVLQLKNSNKGLLDIFRSVRLGAGGARSNALDQVSRVVQYGHDDVGDVPMIIGETGIPFNMNHGEAFQTGNYYRQIHALDATLTACEKNLVGYTLWNYSAINDHRYGDHWNLEDFSFYTPSDKLSSQVDRCLERSMRYLSLNQQRCVQDLRDKREQALAHWTASSSTSLSEIYVETTTTTMTATAGDVAYYSSTEDIDVSCTTVVEEGEKDKKTETFSMSGEFSLRYLGFDIDIRVLEPLIAHEVLNVGGRALEAVVRPYAGKIVGVPIKMVFDRVSKTFKLHFDCGGMACQPGLYTEIFVPHFQYKHGIAVTVSDGAYQYDPTRQTLYYEHDIGKCHKVKVNLSEDDERQQQQQRSNTMDLYTGHVHTVMIKPTIR